MKFYKLNKNLIILTLLFFAVFIFRTRPAQAILRISPERFEFKVDQNNKNKFINDSITVQVDGNEPVRLKVYAEIFDLSEAGALILNSKNIVNNQLKENIRFNPTEFIVQPGESQKIRFTVMNLQNFNIGESRVAIFLEDVNSKTQTLQNINTGAQAKINVKTRIAIPIYVDKGQVQKSGEITNFIVKNSENKLQYELSIKSTGNSKIRISGICQIIKDKNLIQEFPVESHPIQAGTIGKFKGDLPVYKLDSNTEYKLKINIFYKDQNNKNKNLTKEINFKLN